MSRAGLVAALRDADWLTPDRTRAYARLLVAVTVAALALWIGLSQGGLDPSGKPLGTDFLSFWSASALALSGDPAAAYDPAAHRAVQQELFGAGVGYYAFLYPPVFLLACLPLALLPYMASLAAWLALTGLAYWKMLERLTAGRFGLVALLAFPAVFLTATHGQNAFLTAALMGGGILLWDRRPILAGILLGCLVLKPHLAVAVPFALLAAGRWKVLASAGLTALALAALSWALLGEDTWHAFLGSTALARAALETGLVEHAKMQSVFAAARMLGAGIAVSYAIQIAAALAAIACVMRLSRRRAPAEGAAVAAATFLVSPFLLDYDMTLLAIPIAWLAGEGLRAGFRPWEKIMLLAAFVLPGIARGAATYAHLPLTPLIVAAVLALLLRRMECR